jgi:hypothetical protein
MRAHLSVRGRRRAVRPGLRPSGTPTNNDVTEAFDDGVMVLAGGKLDIKPFGLVRHQSVCMMWSNKEGRCHRMHPIGQSNGEH